MSKTWSHQREQKKLAGEFKNTKAEHKRFDKSLRKKIDVRFVSLYSEQFDSQDYPCYDEQLEHSIGDGLW